MRLEHVVQLEVDANRVKDWRPPAEWDFLEYERAIMEGAAKVVEVKLVEEEEVPEP